VWLEGLNLPFLGLEAEVYGGSPNIEPHTVTMDFSRSLNGVPTPATVTFDIREVDLNVVTVGLNLLARLPKGPIQPYGGAGLALIYGQMDNVRSPSSVTVVSGTGTRVITGPQFQTEFRVSGDDVENLFVRSSDFVPGLQLMGGLRAFIMENVALFAEYKYVMAEFEFRDLEVDYEASHIFGGMEYHFGPGAEKKRQ
jgi:opacity protein-like surface antigen